MSNYDQALYDVLAEMRLKLAKEIDKPAFVVFSNRTLVEMAAVFPGTKETFLAIAGVGPAKWEQYGQLFLDAIVQYCAQKGIAHGRVEPKQELPRERKSSSQNGDLASLLDKIREFHREREWEKFHSPKNLVMDLGSEVGELLDLFRWLSEVESYLLDEKALEDVRDEIGDAFRVLVYLSHKLGIDPIEAAHKKLEKLEKKYPADLCRGKALKYTAYEQASNPED